jgi:hypothetical protein
MTDLCTIGPVSIENAHLFDTNTFDFSNEATRTVASGTTLFGKGNFKEKYGFELICSYDEALQLVGLVEQGEIIWMNTSDLTDNDYMQHKGWVILTGVAVDLENPTQLANVKIDYIKISDHEKEYLDMNYTRGIYDGVNIDPAYDPVSTVYQLNEDGTDSTTSWSTIKEYPTTATTSWAPSGTGVLDLACTSASSGKWAYAWVYCDTKTFKTPYTLETEVATSTAAPAGSYYIGDVSISPNVYGNNDKTFVTKGKKQYLNCRVIRTDAARYIKAEVTISSGKTVQLIPQISVGTTGNVVWKIQMYYNGYVRISTNVNGAGYVQRYYGPSQIPTATKYGSYVTLTNNNKASSSRTVSFDNIKVYNSNSVTFPNTVMLPVGATTLDTTTGTRVGADGTSSYIVDPADNIPFQMDSTANLYKNSVKLMSTNNDDGASRQVFGKNIKLTPTTTTLSNGFTRLTFDADEIIVSGYYSGQWNEINRFDVGTSIDLIKPLRITPNIVILQVNAIKITMLRGDPIVKVEHPYTALAYVLKDRYYHDGVTTSSPGAAANITMEDVNTGYYATVYNNAASTYRLLLVKVEPCTILSDSLPASEITGIGWVDNGATGYETAPQLAQQFYKQTRTGISLRQII